MSGSANEEGRSGVVGTGGTRAGRAMPEAKKFDDVEIGACATCMRRTWNKQSTFTDGRRTVSRIPRYSEIRHRRCLRRGATGTGIAVILAGPRGGGQGVYAKSRRQPSAEAS